MLPRSFLKLARNPCTAQIGLQANSIRTFVSTRTCLRPDKPKASTPLRKSAAASLPLREKPTISPSQIQSIFTLTTAERYNIEKLKKTLPTGAQLFQDAFWLPRWSAANSEGEVFVFYSNGSVVCWGLTEGDAAEFARKHITDRKAEISPFKESETEDLDFIQDPSEQTRLQGDLIVLGQMPALDPSTPHPQIRSTTSSPAQPSTPTSPSSSSTFLPPTTFHARYAFSQALARSTALSALETSLDTYLSSTALEPAFLSSTGKPGLSTLDLAKKVGELLKFRQNLILNEENYEDVPDFYWAEASLERYFKSLSDALEIRARVASVNKKITYAHEVQSVLRQLLTETSSHRMELIIIALIAVEVVIAIIRDGPELWHMFAGAPADSESHKASIAA